MKKLIPYTLILIIFFSCSQQSIYRKIPKSLSSDKDINQLLTIALKPDTEPAKRYTAMEPVISMAIKYGEHDWLISILSTILEQYPQDPYGAFYLMAIAIEERENGSMDMMLDYLRRLIKNYPDIEIDNRSIHLAALNEIATKTDNPHEAIAAREKMNIHFPGQIETAENHYYLAHEYRKIGDWNNMYKSYEMFMDNPEATIPGVPDARSNVMDALQFHMSDKSWTVRDLDTLIRNIKYAINKQDINLLKSYQSDNFFLMNWSQETSDSFTHIPMTLGSFLTSRVHYKQDLDAYSNDKEAFLWTSGWTWKIPIWYFYFRRIDYPADPEINGRWEWTGIYFGERL